MRMILKQSAVIVMVAFDGGLLGGRFILSACSFVQGCSIRVGLCSMKNGR
jgi:hypothetical protein